MVGPLVDGELADYLPPQPVLGKHPADGPFHRQGRPLGHEADVPDASKAARVSRVPVEDLLLLLAPGQADPLGVDHDDVVPRVHVRGVDGLVLATEDLGHLGSEPAQHGALGVDHVPAAFDVARLRREGLHGLSRSHNRRPELADRAVYLGVRQDVKGLVS